MRRTLASFKSATSLLPLQGVLQVSAQLHARHCEARKVIRLTGRQVHGKKNYLRGIDLLFDKVNVSGAVLYSLFKLGHSAPMETHASIQTINHRTPFAQLIILQCT